MNANPDWKTELPHNVADLIEKEQLIQELGIRGLASGDSREFSTAVERLKQTLLTRYCNGFDDGLGHQKRRMYTAYLYGALGWFVAAGIGITWQLTL